MFLTVTILFSASVYVQGSGVVQIVQAEAVLPSPVVAASSQYFQRTFNRLVVPPPILEQPIFAPVVPQVTSNQPVNILPATNAIPQANIIPESNIAIAIATAQAAPVSTILLPPYPFAPNAIPIPIDFNSVNIPTREETTKRNSDPETTTKSINSSEREPIEPASNNNDLSQLPLETNNQVFDSYGMQPPKPEKLKTQVEIVPVPLQYIMPPPLKPSQPIKHFHTFIPTRTKIFIRPVKYVSSPLKIRYKVPSRYSSSPYRVQKQVNAFNPAFSPSTFIRRPLIARDTEPTTFSPFKRPNTKPPRF